MPRIFDFGGRGVERAQTVASLRALKGTGRRAVQVTADTAEEAAAAEAAGIDMVVCRASNVAAVRRGSTRVFVTAALGFAEAVTGDEMLRTALGALTAGADAVITGRALRHVEMLAAEGVSVVGHLGFVPRRSTWRGGVRAVGRTAEEALALWEDVRRLGDAGAFAAEMEFVAAPALEEIAPRTGLVTISLGSGPAGEVAFLFASDVTGETPRPPRHARTYGNLARLRREMEAARVAALSAFREDVERGGFPGPEEACGMEPRELAALRERLLGAAEAG